jgi:hypothetical protein
VIGGFGPGGPERHERPEPAPPDDGQDGRQEGEHHQDRHEHAGRAGRPEARGAVDLGQREREQGDGDGQARGDDRRAGRAQRVAHRHVLVLVASELLAVAGDEQQRVVGARADDEDRHDRRRLAVDGDADLGQAVAEAAHDDLGEDHGEDREEPEDRAAVDGDQQHDHQRQRREQQRAVDVLEDLDRVGRHARGPGDLDLQALRRLALLGHRLAIGVDGIDDVVALARCR